MTSLSRVHEVLALRLDLSQAAVKKYTKVDLIAYRSRVHDTLQAWGAQRTGRWAGRGLQLQNLKRTPKNLDDLVELLVDDPETFFQFYALEDLGGIVRAAITAPDGKALVVSDLSSIESRVLGWLTDCVWINQTFAAGKDTYKAFAQMWLGIPHDQVDKATRTLAKPPFLGFGYGIGAVGLEKYADSLGVAMTPEQCQDAITKARKACHEVPAAWKVLEGMFRHTVTAGDPCVYKDRVTFRLEGRFLTLELPSGRKLYYDSPEVAEDGTCSYMGWDQYANKWERIVTWGGKLIENIVQAIARDVLAFGAMLYTKAGGTVVGHVHDEVIAEEDEDFAQESLMILNLRLSTPPPWAPDMLLGSEGYVSKWYRKD